MQNKTYKLIEFNPTIEEEKEFKKQSRQCCVCDKKLYGRSDKVFCDIHCKNKYHQDIRKHSKSAAVNTVKTLQKNYIILCNLLGTKCDRYIIKKLKLQEMGFNFEIVSGMSKNPYGLKMDVFELSWYYTSNNNIVVMQDREQAKISPYLYRRWELHTKPLQTRS